MASYVIRPADLDVSAVTYGAVRVSENKTKSVQMSHDKKPIVLQTPEMYVAAYGLGKWENQDGSVKYSIDLSFTGVDERPVLKTFFDKVEQLDTKLVADAVDNSQAWFGKKLASIDVAEALYTKHIRYSKDKETGELSTKYPPNFKLNLPKRDGKFVAEVYDKDGEPIDLEAINTKRAKVTAVIQCTGIWIIAGRFGYSWKVLKLKVVPQEVVKGPAFLEPEDTIVGGDLEEEDEDDVAVPDVNDIVVPSDGEKLVESSDEEEEEDELEAPPPPPVVKKVVRRTKAVA